MQRRTLWYALLILAIITLTSAAWSKEEFPKPVGLINDFAGVIPQEDRQKMEAVAGEVLQKTGTSLVVATVKSMGDTDVDTYANELYRAWGIGKKGEDKGVLILLALQERKVRIETGYGVEGILPDGLVGAILDRYTFPFLKSNEYGKGLYNALVAVSQVVAKDAGVQLTGKVNIYSPSRRESRGIGLFPVIFLLIVIFVSLLRGRGGILSWLLLSSLGGRNGRGGRFGGSGGGFGGFGGGFGGFGGGGSGGGGASRSF